MKRQYGPGTGYGAELKKLPERPAGMRMVPTGKTVADEWHAAHDDAARREILSGFNVRVTLFPASTGERVRITGADLWAEAAQPAARRCALGCVTPPVWQRRHAGRSGQVLAVAARSYLRASRAARRLRRFVDWTPMSAPTAPLTPTVDGHTIPIGGTTIPALLPQTDILGPFIKAASAMAQQEIAVLKALPADKQQEQLTIRLGQLQMFGLLTPDEVATLQGLSAASRANAVIGAPPIITPDGSPSLCGFIGSALLRGRPNPVDQPQSDTNVPPGVDFQSILDNRWVGATLGGLTCAVVGGCMYGGPGALVGFSVGFTAVLM